MEIKLGDLASRAVRKTVTGSSNGSRIFAYTGQGQTKDDDGNIVSQFISAVFKFGGFLVGKLFSAIGKFFTFSFSAIWGWVVSTAQFIYNFNFNATDEELNQSVEQSYQQLAGSLGGTLGNVAGFLACGVLPGALIFAFNEPLGVHILNNVGEEACQELCSNVASLSNQTFRALTQHALTFSYTKLRAYFSKDPQPISDDRFTEMVKAGEMTQAEADAQKKLRDAKNAERKPWSFALKREEAIESISNKTLRNFVDNFAEELGEACIEAGYVVAQSTDSYLAQAKMANQAILGPDTTVEITLNRSLDPTPATP